MSVIPEQESAFSPLIWAGNSAKADGPEITCGLPQNDVCADASVGAWALTDFRHYLAPTDCAAVAPFGTVRNKDRLQVIAR
jgi:hypothetical protein